MVRYDLARATCERKSYAGGGGVGEVEENTRRDKRRRGETAFVERTIYASRDCSLPHHTITYTRTRTHKRTHGNTDITNTHASQVYTTHTHLCAIPRMHRFVLSQNTRMFLFDFNSYYCLTGLLKRQLNIHHFLLTRFLASGELLV